MFWFIFLFYLAHSFNKEIPFPFMQLLGGESLISVA